MTGVDRDAIEAERDFLLRSLDDLEAERAEGNVDDETYRTLHDDYTARAAAAIRSLDSDTDLRPERAPTGSKAMRWLTIGGIVVFALVAAFLLTRAVGQRRPGGTITGNSNTAVGRHRHRSRSRAEGGRGGEPPELRGAHRLRAVSRADQPARSPQRDPRVRRRRPARPEPAGAADLRWLGGRAPGPAGEGRRRDAARCSTPRSNG